MGGLHGFSLLRRPLPLLVTSLVLSGVLCSSSGASTFCNLSCCFVLPACNNARLVTCDCPHMDMMILRKGDIPETVRDVNILNTRHVTIEEDAINGLHSLNHVTISGIDKVEIKQDGMASQEETELRSVTIQNVGSLQVESKAFSGFWQPETSIRMHHIGGLDVESNALNYQVTELGPRVSLRHVEMLNLKPNGFAASITELDLYNVTMDVCHGGSFGGNSLYTDLKKVNIYEAKTRCFYGQNDLATFNIRSLKMEAAHPQAFSGNMKELIIKDSHIATIHERGFDIRVTRMQISGSYINDLRSNGLSVLASIDIRIEYLRIDDLQRNALAGLQMEHSSVGDQQRLLLNHLEIVRAEDGSLALSKSVNFQNLQINFTHVISRKNIVCPTEKWGRMLIGASPNDALSNAQHEVLSSLMGNTRCQEAPSVVQNVFHSETLEEPLRDQGNWDNLDNTNDSRRFTVVFSTVDSLSAVEGPDPASGGVQPHESEVDGPAPAFGGVQPVYQHCLVLCLLLCIVLAYSPI